MSESSRKSVILLHGGPALSRYFGPLLTHLSERFHVLSYTQTGKSIAQLVVELEAHVREIVLRDGQSPILVGHSWGAILALLYTAKQVSKSKSIPPKLVLLGSGPLEDETKDRFRANLSVRIPPSIQAELDALDEEFDTTDDPAIRERLQLRYQDLVTPFYNLDPESTKRLPHSNFDIASFEAISKDLNAKIDRGEIPKLLARVRVPVVSFHGAQDPIPHLETHAFLRSHLEFFRANTYVGAGHFPWVEPGGIAERFLADVAAEIRR